jgi:hypothetical protein
LSTKPENKPVGSANAAIIDEYDSDDRGFWAVKEEEVHVCHAEPDHQMDDSDSDNEDDSYDEWEAFCADTWGVEDTGDLDWARLDIQLAKEGEKQNAKEEAGAATLLKDSAPHTGSQLIPHNMPHAHTITNTLEPHWAPGKEGYMPYNGDRHLQTTFSYREQVTDTMCHTHCPHNFMHLPEFAHLDDPMPAIHTHEGQSPSFNANMQAHQAPWLGPGTTTKEQDAPLVSAALLEGEEKRLPAVSSEQTAVPGTSSNFNLPKPPASATEAISPQGLDSLPAQLHRPTHTYMPSCIMYDTQPEEAVHLGTNAPCLVPCL